MRKNKIFCIITFTILLLSSCGNNQGDNDSHANETNIEQSSQFSEDTSKNLNVSTPFLENIPPFETEELGFINGVGEKIHLFQTREEIESIIGTPTTITDSEGGPGNTIGPTTKVYYGETVYSDYIFVYEKGICISMCIRISPDTPENT